MIRELIITDKDVRGKYRSHEYSQQLQVSANRSRDKCCDYNFVYTLFPAPILHNMDIIIGLVLCTP